MVEDILEAAEPAAEKLKEFEGKIRLIGQYDADGISATAIAHEMLDRLGKEFEYEIIKQLYLEDVERLAEEDEELLLFVDIGSGKSRDIQELVVEEAGKDVIVSDHHSPQLEEEDSSDNFVHMNPHFLGHDGGEAISAAGMTYLLAKAVDPENYDLVPIALIGATGDIQKQDGEFLGLNEQLLKEAEEHDLIHKRKGLDLYGRTTKPVHKSLMYTSDPHLDGITNNESGAIQFLKSVGVDIRRNGDFKTLEELDESEEKKIIHGLIKQGYDVENLLRNIYVLKNGHGIDEFSTIINACGRLGEPRKGVKILLEEDLELARKMSKKYGRAISSALSYVENNRDNEDVVYEKNIGVIDGGSNIDENFIGTVTTITMSNGFFSSPVVMGVAEAERDKLKVSSRATKDVVEAGMNLGEIIEGITEELDGEGGGHNIAAGAKIPAEHKQEFIDRLDEKVGERL
ncbi:MAG: DHHA1 domain-containing protein [Candidatus Nanohaloarchaea archaeon]